MCGLHNLWYSQRVRRNLYSNRGISLMLRTVVITFTTMLRIVVITFTTPFALKKQTRPVKYTLARLYQTNLVTLSYYFVDYLIIILQ